MRVLHVISSLASSSGGPPMVACGIAFAQQATGHEASILCYESNGHECNLVSKDGTSAIPVTRVAQEKGMGKLFAREFYRVAFNMAQDVDILHLHGIWEPCLYAAGRAAVSAGTPYVLQPHGMLDPWAFNQRRLKKQFFYSLFQKKLVSRSAMLQASNRHEAECIREMVPGALVAQVPNPVRLEELEPIPDPGAFHKLHPELEGKPYILFLSRLAPGKGLDLLAAAFAKNRATGLDVKLAIVGNDFGATAMLERQVEQLGIQDHVHLVGPAYGPDKAAAFAGASCFCLASEHESFGLVIAEALACRVPVVISDTCHFPEIAETGAGIETTLDVNAISEALERVLSATADEQKKMGDAGRALVEAKYTYDAVGKCSIDAYQHAMSQQISPVAN